MLTKSDHCASSTSTTPDPQSWTLGGHGGANGNPQWTRCGMDRTTKSACATDQTITSSQSQPAPPARPSRPAKVSLRRRPDHHVQPKSACATGQTITSSQSQQPVCHVSFTRKPDHRIIRGYLTECSANVRYDKYQLDCGLVYVMSASASDQTMTPVVTTASITISHAITSCHVSQH